MAVKTYIFIIIALAIIFTGCASLQQTEFQNGDILFQSLNSPQCEAIKIATKSKYSHCGLINIIDGQVYVLEGIQPVKLTPVVEWINRGIDKHYVAKRIPDLNDRMKPEDMNRVVDVGAGYLGKNYDFYFGWSDSLIYCSELVWKVYRDAWDIELCSLKKLGDFDLTHPVVRAKAEERYGDSLPLDEPVVAPADLFNSELLVELKNIKLPQD